MKMYLIGPDEEHYSILHYFSRHIFVGKQSVTNLLPDDKNFLDNFFYDWAFILLTNIQLSKKTSSKKDICNMMVSFTAHGTKTGIPEC